MIETTLIAANACLKAGEAIMKVYNTGFDVEIKPDQSPITLADKRANSIIQEYLEKTGIPIISEENDRVAYKLRKEWNQLWMVDPLDGTKEFVKRNGEFAVNIALIKEGYPVLGLIYVPVTGNLYIGEASKNRTLRIKVKNHRALGKSDYFNAHQLVPAHIFSATIRVITSRSHLNKSTIEFIESFKLSGRTVTITQVGSSLKFCLMAEGKVDLYPRFGPSMEWDTAAGQAICEGVGLIVRSTKNNLKLVYNKGSLFNDHFLVEPDN